MKFEKLAEIATERKKLYLESARTVLRSIKIYPCGSTQEHASEMMAAAHFRAEAYAWYKREQRALRQAQGVRK